MEKKASLVGRLLSENQMSEAFINSMFLALSGGFQDAYTYLSLIHISEPTRRS